MKDKKYINKIIGYIDKINRYMEDVKNLELFIQNEEKIDAVILNLEQIGETAKKISKTTKDKYEEVKWRKIISLRNMISHEYSDLDKSIIYITATTKINELKNQFIGVDFRKIEESK
ncbi:MAG: DUF86 domain-containing protein [Candidatus Izimaplasma sp.]|nr:DUF86 domain-containing protein [Candidatus Izimaplasma bacterium]